MSVDELIAALVREEDRASRDLIKECARHGTAMVDALAQVIGPTVDWNNCESDGHWWLRLHAAFILGLMDDAGSARLLLQLMQRLADGEDDNLDEWLAGYWPALFRNKPETILPEVEAFAWSAHAQPYMRGHVFEVMFAAASRRGPEALDASLARAAQWLAGAGADDTEGALAAVALLDFPRPAHRALLESMAATQGDMFGAFAMRDVEEAYSGPDRPSWLRFEDPWKFYLPEQIAARQARWQAEEQRRLARASTGASLRDAPLREHQPQFLEPYVREAPKVGRNDPCPCGSGRKYKKCCLHGDAAPANLV